MHQHLYDYYVKALSAADMERFEVHLLKCPACQEEMARLERAFQVMCQDQAYYREVVGPKVIPLKRLNLRRQLVRYAIAAIILITIGCSLFSYFTQPAYFGLARLTDEPTLLTLKGESGQGEFETALQQFRQKDYVDAISGFKKFLVTQPTHYQTHYFLGLANLAAGETNILWYHRFSTTRTQEGIFYLQHAYELAGDNLFYQEACFWLLGTLALGAHSRSSA